jgi:hypothetical protein
VRVEPDDSEVAADTRHDSERAEAVPREYEWEGASIRGDGNVPGYLTGGREQRGDLVRLRIESYPLDLDLVAVESQRVGDARVEEPVRPGAHTNRHVAKVIGDSDERDVHVSP